MPYHARISTFLFQEPLFVAYHGAISEPGTPLWYLGKERKKGVGKRRRVKTLERKGGTWPTCVFLGLPSIGQRSFIVFLRCCLISWTFYPFFFLRPRRSYTGPCCIEKNAFLQISFLVFLNWNKPWEVKVPRVSFLKAPILLQIAEMLPLRSR